MGSLSRIVLIGVFALFAEASHEPVGTLGATVQLMDEKEVVFRHSLKNGRHYGNALDLAFKCLPPGDGTERCKVGEVEIDGQTVRVDALSIDVPEDVDATKLLFKDLGSPASFVIYDVLYEFAPVQGCPFHSHSGGVSLAEVASCVRLGDRVKFVKAIDQLERAILATDDLDEARGQTLTFLAILTSALLEMGGSRELHRFQLQASRALEKASNSSEILDTALELIAEVSGPLMTPPESATKMLIDRALALVERNYAKRLTDSSVAAQLGLSTSHFRYLFREATGQPFHRYLVALRLEKAKLLLSEQALPVSSVAEAVGFTGLSHFSRAFAQRFNVSPTSIRRPGA